jgi:NADH:ubiquinone oxidoreductase subunit E
MTRLSDHNVVVAKEIIARYPKKKSALIPLVHLSQQQNGYVTEDAMRHVAELLDVTPAEVYGTASFYEMFRFEPTGRYLINICGTMSCALMGGDDLMHHAEHTLGVRARFHHQRRSDHAAARRVSGCLHRGADAAGQLPAPLPSHTRGIRPTGRRSACRQTRCRGAATRHARAQPPADPCRSPGRRPSSRRRRRGPCLDPSEPSMKVIPA